MDTVEGTGSTVDTISLLVREETLSESPVFTTVFVYVE